MARSNTESSDGRADPNSRTIREIYGPLIPETVDDPSDWDPSLAPEGFIPKTAPNGRPFRTAAWDGGLSDLGVARSLYDTEPGAPVVLVYASIQAGAQMFEGQVIEASGRRLEVESGDGTTRTVYAADMAGRTDAVHDDGGAYIGKLCEVRLTPTEERLATEQAAREDR